MASLERLNKAEDWNKVDERETESTDRKSTSTTEIKISKQENINPLGDEVKSKDITTMDIKETKDEVVVRSATELQGYNCIRV